MRRSAWAWSWPTGRSTMFSANFHRFPDEPGKNTSIAALTRSPVPTGPMTVSGLSRWLSNWASRKRNGRPPKWSPWRCDSITASMRLGSIPSHFSATSEVAPKSSAVAAAAVSMKKHVFARPPDPNASPQPTTVRRMASRLRAWARGELRMPAPHVRKFVRHAELRQLHEIEPDEPGDVGDREAVAGDEPAVGELAVEKAQELDDPRLVGLAPGGDLRHLHLGHRRVEVAENRRDRAEQAELEAPLPHLDTSPLERAGAEQRRLGMQLLEIAADRDRLADHGPVVELEGRSALQRIDGHIGRRLVLEPGKVDRDDRDRDAFLGEKYPHPARVRRPAGVVELHRGAPFGRIRTTASAVESIGQAFSAAPSAQRSQVGSRAGKKRRGSRRARGSRGSGGNIAFVPRRALVGCALAHMENRAAPGGLPDLQKRMVNQSPPWWLCRGVGCRLPGGLRVA